MTKLHQLIDIPKQWDIVYIPYFTQELELSDVLENNDIKILKCVVDVVGVNGVVLLRSTSKINGNNIEIFYGISEYQYKYFKLRQVAVVVKKMIIHSWNYMKNQIDIPAVIHTKRRS